MMTMTMTWKLFDEFEQSILPYLHKTFVFRAIKFLLCLLHEHSKSDRDLEKEISIIRLLLLMSCSLSSRWNFGIFTTILCASPLSYHFHQGSCPLPLCFVPTFAFARLSCRACHRERLVRCYFRARASTLPCQSWLSVRCRSCGDRCACLDLHGLCGYVTVSNESCSKLSRGDAAFSWEVRHGDSVHDGTVTHGYSPRSSPDVPTRCGTLPPSVKE